MKRLTTMDKTEKKNETYCPDDYVDNDDDDDDYSQQHNSNGFDC